MNDEVEDVRVKLYDQVGGNIHLMVLNASVVFSGSYRAVQSTYPCLLIIGEIS